MQTKTPEAGKAYVDPTGLKVFVEDVTLIDADGDAPAGFYVEGCDLKNKDNEGAIGYEWNDDEWIEHGFIPYTS